jgi:hypothetical protein
MRLVNLFDSWSKKYKKSINCSNPKGFSQRAHCAGRKARRSGRKTKSASVSESQKSDHTLIDALRDFLPIAVDFLKLKELPKIHLAKHLHDTHVPTFGRFTNQSKEITVAINNRNPVDIIRTLAHELAHYAQGERGELDSESWHTGSAQENQAHEQAGIMMREFDKKFPKYLSAQAVDLNESISKNEVRDLPWEHLPLDFDFKVYVAPYKNTVAVFAADIQMHEDRSSWYFSFVADLASHNWDLVNLSKDYYEDPDADLISEVVAEVLAKITSKWGTNWEEIGSELHGGFSVGDLEEDRDQHCSSAKAVPALKSALTNRKTQLNRLGDKALYDKIDKIMRRIAMTYGIAPEKLHDLWVDKYGEIPDTWILDEIGVPPVSPVSPMPGQLPRRSPPWPSPEERRKKKT